MVQVEVGYMPQDLTATPDKGAIALPSNCNQPEAASRMLSSSETTLPSFPTSWCHFITLMYRSPSNPSASTRSLLPPRLPLLVPLLLSPVSVRRRFLLWSRLRHLGLWSVTSVGVSHALSSEARVPWSSFSSFEQISIGLSPE